MCSSTRPLPKSPPPSCSDRPTGAAGPFEMVDPFHLDRFVEAQSRSHVTVLAELGRGRKRSHWMWFVFPQLKGLGRSSTSEFYGIQGLEEARAYLAHPILGPRLRECAGLVNRVDGRTAEQIFGFPDWTKFRSSMTLFSLADPEEPAFRLALDRYFGGEADPEMLRLLDGR